MIVRIYPGTWAEFGAERWEVEWIEVTPSARKRVEADSSDYDPDVDTVTCARYYKTEAIAKREARRWWKRRSDWLAYGSVTVTKQVVDWLCEEDRVAEWVYVGEPVYVD
jgi:hypothetical protein